MNKIIADLIEYVKRNVTNSTEFIGRLKSMQIADTIPYPVLDPVDSNWNFLEIWIDPLQSPPYLLLLLGDQKGHCQILEPANNYQTIQTFSNYEDAQFWLLEDEYEPVEGRLSESVISN